MTDATFVSEHGYWALIQTNVPFVMPGLLPRIYLPADMDDEKWEKILAHERQHIKNFAPVIKSISAAAAALYWFHPLVWLAVSLMGEDLEMYCDECVLRGKGIEECRDYSAALLEYTAQTSELTFTMRFGESNTGNRIRHILHMKKPHLAVCLVLVLFIGVSGMMFLTSRQSENQQEIEKQAGVENQLKLDGGIQNAGGSQSIVQMLSNIPEEDYEKGIDYEKFIDQWRNRAGEEHLPDAQILSLYEDQAEDIHIYCYIEKNYQVLGTVINYKGTYSYFDVDIMVDYFYSRPSVHVKDIDGDSAAEIVCTYSLGHGTGVSSGGLTVFDVQADHTVLGYTLEERDMENQVGKLIRYDREHGK